MRAELTCKIVEHAQRGKELLAMGTDIAQAENASGLEDAPAF